MTTITTDAVTESQGLPRLTRWQRFRQDLTVFKVVSIVVALALSALAVYPLSRVLLRLFVVDGEVDLSAFREAFTQNDLGELLFNTAIVVAGSAILALLIGSVLAWLNERTNARLGIATDSLPLIPFLLPPIAGAVGWALLLSERAGLLNAFLRYLLSFVGIEITEGPLNIYSWWGLIFVYTIYQIPYAFLLVSAGLRNVDPAMEEQSRISGASLFRTMRKVTIPAVRPSLGAAVLLMIWFGFALFSVPVIIGTGAGIDVLSVRIVRLLSFTYPPQTAVGVGLSSIVIVVVGTAWFFQMRLLRRGHHATVGGKGHRTTRIHLGAWKWPARGLLFGYVFVASILPLIGLALVALNGFWTANINWGALDLDSFRQVLFEDEVTRRALNNSIALALVGATIGIVAAAILALLLKRSSSRLVRVIDGAVKLPAAISSIVIAVGFLLAFSGPPFNLSGSFLILLLAYLVLYMPQGSVAADAAASQVGQELPEASQIAGARPGRTFWRINFPLMLPGLAAGWSLLFVRMAGDLTASAMLSGTANPVVGFRILEIYQGASYPPLAALSIVLTLVMLVVIVAVTLLVRRRGAFKVMGASA